MTGEVSAKFEDIEAIILSHGHFDHCGGLLGVFKKVNKELPVFVHRIPDPFHDDQGIALNIKGKGLVVVGGCSHAGIINTIKHIQKVSGINDVHMVMGGFHLAGENEKLIDPTIREMKAVDPDYIIPMHCTGWNAINRFAQEMPDNFILNSVGTTYIFH